MSEATDGIINFTDDELKAEFMSDEESPGEVPTDDEYAEVDSEFIDKQWRSPVARKYEKRTRKVLNTIFRQTVAHESTVPDAAAIVLHGPQFAEKLGDLANHDPRVRRGIDMLTEGTENPYIAAAVAGLILSAQIYRNHQDQLSPSAVVESVKQSRIRASQRPAREFKIPFTKRTIQIRFRLRVPAVDNFTNDPNALADYVFSNADIQEQLKKANITNVAWNGHGPTRTSPRPKR